MSFLQLLIPGLIPVSMLQDESGFGTVTQLADTGERLSSHLLLMEPINIFSPVSFLL